MGDLGQIAVDGTVPFDEDSGEGRHGMSATSASPVGAARRPLRPREPFQARFLAVTLLAALLTVLARGWPAIILAAQELWAEMLFWALLVFVINLFPVQVGELTFTLDMPILLAVAVLYPPEVSGLLAFISAIDSRELSGRVALSRALFNRTQVAISVLSASYTFHSIAQAFEPWGQAVLATALAIAVSYSTNVLLVSAYTALRSRVGLRTSFGQLSIGRLGQFLATYLGYCVTALVVARLFKQVGAWSVLTFMVPMVVAKQMLTRGLDLQTASHELRDREKLLKGSLDRVSDERRDERRRVAADLHDEVLQGLIGIRLTTDLLRKHSREGAATEADSEELIANTDAAIESLRKVILDLNQSPLGRRGLVPTLEGLARDLRLEWGAKVKLKASLHRKVPDELQLTIYQVAREALLNAVRHSGANRISIVLRTHDAQAVLLVEDDGEGFSVDHVDTASHFGLELMAERVRHRRGELLVDSKPRAGTRLVATFPLEE